MTPSFPARRSSDPSHFSGSNAAQANDIAGWCALTNDIVMWDYQKWASWTLMPFPTWWASAQTIKDAAANPQIQGYFGEGHNAGVRSEEHTSELQSLMRISYAVFCLNNNNTK